MKPIYFVYKGLQVEIHYDDFFKVYEHCNEAERGASEGFTDLGKAIEAAIKKADEDLAYYNNTNVRY